MNKRQLRLPVWLGVLVAALALLASGCAANGSGGGSKTITMGVVPGWTDQTDTAYLLANILQKKGYTVDIKKLSDNAPVYAGLARGDLNLFTSSWLERTHKAYWDQYKSNLEDLDVYYKNASLYLAVPNYSNVHSISDLPSHASEFGGTVYGIEPGAGLMKLTKDSAFPKYGLNKNYKLISSSTTAMLAQLKKATQAKKEIVVTLWRPFWANQAFPVRPLADPKHAYGTTENLHVIAHKGFSQEFPQVANMIKHFKLSDQQYGSLESMVVNKFGENHSPEAVKAWLKQNPDYAPNLEKYLKK